MLGKIGYICLMVIPGISYGQDVERKFYDDNGRAVHESESAYFELRKEAFTDGDTLRSFYTKFGQRRSVEAVNKHGIRHGAIVMYHENGAVKAMGNFHSGMPSGDITSWYPDGTIQSIEFFLPADERGKLGNSGLVDYYDSLGNQIVKNGKGYCECFFDIVSNPKYMEKGKIVEGLRDSVWVGYWLDGRKYFEETYSGGELTSGTSFDKSGNKYSYNLIGEIAQPEGDMKAFYEHVGKTLYYPKEARKRKVEGKVFVEFVIDTAGSVTEVRAIRGLGHGCDEAAVHAIKTSPPWKPGRQRGQPVKQRMVLPLSFRLG